MTLRIKRILCWEDTKKISKRIEKPDDSIKLKYRDDQILYKVSKKSSLYFYDMDTIDCALMFQRPLVLNLADDFFPGGYVSEGSEAQEESLFRRTNYYQTLKKEMYPIKNDECIYSPNVSLLKKNEYENWSLYDNNNKHEFKKLDFIACPGIKYPETIIKQGIEYLNDHDVQLLKIKIRLIIQCALTYHHNVIIFGALGCGPWLNPIHHVATIFQEVLKEYDGTILTFVFAILTTNKKRMIDYFRDAFL